MNGQDKISYNQLKRESFFRGKSPWLKVGVAIVLILLFCSWSFGWLRLDAGKKWENRVPIAPMQVHAKVPILTKKDLEGKKLAVLTFDDGPSNITTPRLLDILKEKSVSATFFVLGKMANLYPEVVKREYDEGHEVATHTMNHSQLNKLSSEAIKTDIGASEDVLRGILGQGPRLLRPPYGAVNETVRKVVDLPMILWSVDTLDWKNRNTESILKNTNEQIYDGAIILMHDIHSTTVDAVPVLIDELRKNGYEFVTVSQLAAIRGKNLEKGVLYGGFKP